jgi:uncharacterized HAD superfamily protein
MWVSRGLRIAVDVDGVLADLAGMFLKIHREDTGIELGREFIDEWEFWHKLSMTRQQFLRMLVRVWSRWEEIGLLEEDAAEDVEQLATLGSVDILTQRPAETVENVKRWLNHHGIKYRSFTWVPLKSSKTLFTYDAYIDDSPRLAEQLVGKGRLLLLYDQPWNRKTPKAANIVRVASLDEAYRVLAEGLGSV